MARRGQISDSSPPRTYLLKTPLKNTRASSRTKGFQRASKAAKLSVEEQAELLEETQKGFKRPFSNVEAMGTMHTALGPNALSAPDADEKTVSASSSMSLLRASFEKLHDAESPAKAKRGEPLAKAPKLEPMAASPTDVKDARASAHRLQVVDVGKLKTKLVDVLKDAVLAIQLGDAAQDTDLLTTLDERIVLGALCVKKFFRTYNDERTRKKAAEALDCSFPFDAQQGDIKFKRSYTTLEGVVKEATVVQAVSTLAGGRGESRGRFWLGDQAAHRSVATALAQVKMLPAEAPEELMSWTSLEDNCTKIKEGDNALALENVLAISERQKALQEQLRTAIKTPHDEFGEGRDVTRLSTEKQESRRQ